MAITTTITSSGTKTGGAAGTVTLGPVTKTNTDGPHADTAQTFTAATFAAVTFPTLIGSAVIKGVQIFPPSGNTGTITLKGVTGDTGFQIHKTEMTELRFPSITASSFGILCSADTTIEFVWL